MEKEKRIIDTGTYSTVGYQIAFSKLMSIESVNFAICLRQCSEDKCAMIEILEDFVSEIVESKDVFDKIIREFKYVISWYTVNYIQEAYGEYKIGDYAWQMIGEMLDGGHHSLGITEYDSIEELNESIDHVIEDGLFGNLRD